MKRQHRKGEMKASEKKNTSKRCALCRSRRGEGYQIELNIVPHFIDLNSDVGCFNGHHTILKYSDIVCVVKKEEKTRYM